MGAGGDEGTNKQTRVWWLEPVILALVKLRQEIVNYQLFNYHDLWLMIGMRYEEAYMELGYLEQLNIVSKVCLFV